MKYSSAVIERVRNPQRVGALPEDGADVGTGESGTLEAGTTARIQVRLAGERVVEARFKVFGCSAAIAATALVAERLEGGTVREGRAVTAEDLVAVLDLPIDRAHVADVAVEAARRALDDATMKSGQRR